MTSFLLQYLWCADIQGAMETHATVKSSVFVLLQVEGRSPTISHELSGLFPFKGVWVKTRIQNKVLNVTGAL